MKTVILLLILSLATFGQVCQDNPIGAWCLTDEEAQACADNLSLISYDEETDEQTITNTCTNLVYDDNGTKKTYYNFEIEYLDDYQFSNDCLTQKIYFGSEDTKIELFAGNAMFDEWVFDETVDPNQDITFNILHEDLVDYYGCWYSDESDQDTYQWQCFADLEIYLAETELQLTYSFKIDIYLDRVYDDQLTITVTKNEVVGDCCENELQLETVLEFCDNLACDNVLPTSHLEVVRKDDIFVRHRITSSEFAYYYLHKIQLKLGSFVPDIIAYDGGSPGYITYQFQSNVAMPDMTISAVSRIAEVGSRRRALRSDEDILADDYKIKAEAQMSVLTEEEMERSEEREREQTGVIVGIAIFALLIPVTMAASVLYFLKLRGQKRAAQAKYEQAQVIRRSSSVSDGSA